MNLPNRVRPDGSLEATPMRGLFTGNRGIIHDPENRKPNGKRWTTRSWICCSAVWKDRRRDVWGRNHIRRDGSRGAGWSELFFLDEVTALSAGHRPCNACRRPAALAFRDAFRTSAKVGSFQDIDRILHSERWLSSRARPQVLSAIDLPGLPDGVVVSAGGRFFAMRDRRALPWSQSGYGPAVGLGELVRTPALLVTPRSVLAALRAGYRPLWHDSAGDPAGT